MKKCAKNTYLKADVVIKFEKEWKILDFFGKSRATI